MPRPHQAPARSPPEIQWFVVQIKEDPINSIVLEGARILTFAFIVLHSGLETVLTLFQGLVTHCFAAQVPLLALPEGKKAPGSPSLLFQGCVDTTPSPFSYFPSGCSLINSSPAASEGRLTSLVSPELGLNLTLIFPLHG